MKALQVLGLILLLAGVVLTVQPYVSLEVIPDFCDSNYPISLYAVYQGYEIWEGTNTYFDPQSGLSHRPVYWEKEHPSASVSFEVSDVEAWIDSNLIPLYADVTITITGQGTTDPSPGEYAGYLVGEDLWVTATASTGYVYQIMRRNGIDWTSANPGGFLSLAETEVIEVVFVETTEKWMCAHCLAEFDSEAQLRSHLETEHTPVATLYHCNDCGAEFHWTCPYQIEIDTVNKIGRVVLDETAVPTCPVCGEEPPDIPDPIHGVWVWFGPSLIIIGFVMILVGKKRS